MRFAKEGAIPFIIPCIVLGGMLSYGVLQKSIPLLATSILISVIVIGSFQTFKETMVALKNKKFALDYIAILAILTSFLMQEYVVCAVIVLMLSGGNALEAYATIKAKKSLTLLIERIPHEVVQIKQGKETRVPLESIRVEDYISIRKGEVIPLDGILISPNAILDESSLTGEAYPVTKLQGDQIQSGTINTGSAITLQVTQLSKDSTYTRLIEMVKLAQAQRPPFIRLADRYSLWFTISAISIASCAYWFSGNFEYFLAVLVIATPCPLILAAPIAFVGGMNAAARNQIIIKNSASLEALSKATTLVFDKTGTLTLGKPVITEVRIKDPRYTLREVYAIAAAIERSSLHPLAKCIVDAAHAKKVPTLPASQVEEAVGKGITGVVRNIRYTLSNTRHPTQIAIALRARNKLIAEFYFEDVLRPETTKMLHELHNQSIELHIFTGDKRESAAAIINKVHMPLAIKTNYSPQQKIKGIIALKRAGKTIAMIGDGINDAPALAKADVGIVYSHNERTAASEAADIVLIGSRASAISKSITIAQKAVRIAKQSIGVGIGLSTIGMLFAAAGYVPALYGAVIQEVIDVVVIMNALRASTV